MVIFKFDLNTVPDEWILEAMDEFMSGWRDNYESVQDNRIQIGPTDI